MGILRQPSCTKVNASNTNKVGTANHIDSDSDDDHDDKNINTSDGNTVAAKVTATVTTPRIYKIVKTEGGTLGDMMTHLIRVNWALTLL